jgi:N12 class adenine-specific DNA methylase/adenine-specific DNA methylase
MAIKEFSMSLDRNSSDPFTLDLFSNTALSSFGVSVYETGHQTQKTNARLGQHNFDSHDNAVVQMPDNTGVDKPSSSTSPAAAVVGKPVPTAVQFWLDDNRTLAKSWKDRARDNLAAIKLATAIEAKGRSATPDEQAQLIQFTGFGASNLANNCFRRPGDTAFRKGWEEIGDELATAVTPNDYASLARCTQYAHFTPEYIIKAIWQGLIRIGFDGGKVLEPGFGTGLFPALMPEGLRANTYVTGIELDPVTARIARLLYPQFEIVNDDFGKTKQNPDFDLVIGNPPFSDRIVRSDPDYRKHGFRLHDYFIAKAIGLLKPGGIAAFVTSQGTMDKLDQSARKHIASMADLLAAIRLPEGCFKSDAGTDVGVDILFFQKRGMGAASKTAATAQPNWLELAAITPMHIGKDAQATEEQTPDTDHPETERVWINRYFIDHPEMVLGRHDVTRSRFGPEPVYVCRTIESVDLEAALAAAMLKLPENVCVGGDAENNPVDAGLANRNNSEPAKISAFSEPQERHLKNLAPYIREGSYFVAATGALMQLIEGRAVTVAVKSARNKDGIFAKHADIIRKLLPIRDAVRSILSLQEQGQNSTKMQTSLRITWSSFVRHYGPINSTNIVSSTDEATGEVRETHRRPNLAPFLDDPDCWLVASIEDYDLETNTARPGPIFTDVIISPPSAPVITSALDALAVVLSERGVVDIDHVAELVHSDADNVIAELGYTIFKDPANGTWQTADAYLSGAVRTKLQMALAAAELDPQFQRNVDALRDVQPVDLNPSDITARLGAPWIPASDIVAFVVEAMGTSIAIWHTPELASWTVDARHLEHLAAGTTDWGTHRRHAGLLLSDALNSCLPQIFDTFIEDGSEKRILNVEATEAAKEKLSKIKTAFQNWIWTDPDRTDRLARIYNDRFNNLVPRHFDGSHLQLPGASGAFTLYNHQKRVIWRIIAAGSTYIAHAVGAGKTLSMAAAIMEQKRLGLINKAMLVVPGHCLAQAAREFLALYPNARILVADETNFTSDKRHRFLARAATNSFDAIIITHSAFKFIPVPADFEQSMIAGELRAYEALLLKVDSEDRLSRKRIERMKEGHADRLAALKSRKDDLVTLSELGIDKIIVDEAQEFRKLSFSTNMTTLKGVDPNGSQRAWDLYVKTRYLETRNPGRALILASGTPITNTLGEMFTVQRLMDRSALEQRGLYEFDAWASTFGDTSTELELQPSGKYKPVTRIAEFVNVPELIAMFRAFADVVLPVDLRAHVKVPEIKGGKRQIITAEPTPAFKAYQNTLAQRIRIIEERRGQAKKGDDILLSVITDGRHAAIDLRLVAAGNDNDFVGNEFGGNEPGNKLNAMIANVHRIWLSGSCKVFTRKDGRPFDRTGSGQMIFSDLGTIAVEATRGFSAYRWIKQELVRLGIPAAEIAFMQDYKKSDAKQRLFADFNAGKIRILIGSSETMGTGVNVQARLAALHHLDVPWLPSQIEQREGRIIRQGNQHDEIELYAYATLGSLDATMWQNNERKARFIAAALSGDTSVRRLEDIGAGQANQFAMAKAIASGDPRLMQKAGLEAEIARLSSLQSAHVDDQHAIRRRVRKAEFDRDNAEKRIVGITKDIAQYVPTSGDRFAMVVVPNPYDERKAAGRALMTEILTQVQLRKVGQSTLGAIAGFEIMFAGQRHGREGYAYTTAIKRNGFDHEIELDMTVTPLGAIARLEHVPANFDHELREYQSMLEDADRRHITYSSRVGEAFAFEGELELKRTELGVIASSLAANVEVLGFLAGNESKRRTE